MDKDIEVKKRYLEPAPESVQPTEEEKKAEELKGSEEQEQNVNIRFANYTQLIKSVNGDLNSLFSSHLMALIGGYLNLTADRESSGGGSEL